MDYQSLLEATNTSWFLKRNSLTKEDKAFLSNRDTFRHRLLGILSSDYVKRKDLIAHGDIVYAYVFKEWTNEARKEIFDYPTWLYFSPSKSLNDNPLRLKGISAKTSQPSTSDPLTKEDKKFNKLLTENLSDCSYFEVPGSYTGGQLVYLSIVYARLNQIPDFHLGLNLIIANASISKEVIFLPERYWTEDYKKAYRNNEL